MFLTRFCVSFCVVTKKFNIPRPIFRESARNKFSIWFRIGAPLPEEIFEVTATAWKAHAGFQYVLFTIPTGKFHGPHLFYYDPKRSLMLEYQSHERYCDALCAAASSSELPAYLTFTGTLVDGCFKIYKVEETPADKLLIKGSFIPPAPVSEQEWLDPWEDEIPGLLPPVPMDAPFEEKMAAVRQNQKVRQEYEDKMLAAQAKRANET